jgi:hypothetical protein
MTGRPGTDLAHRASPLRAASYEPFPGLLCPVRPARLAGQPTGLARTSDDQGAPRIGGRQRLRHVRPDSFGSPDTPRFSQSPRRSRSIGSTTRSRHPAAPGNREDHRGLPQDRSRDDVELDGPRRDGFDLGVTEFDSCRAPLTGMSHDRHRTGQSLRRALRITLSATN